jgi:uncharacterized protein
VSSKPFASSGAPALTARLVGLVASLRAGGVKAGVAELVQAHKALGCVDPADRQQAYFALRSTLCSDRHDLGVFDEAFAACFDQSKLFTTQDFSETPQPALQAQAAVPGDAGEDEPPDSTRPVPAVYSAVELFRDKDFSSYTDEERRMAKRLMARLAQRGPTRLSRRMRASRKRGAHSKRAHDLRQTLRRSLRYGGEPIERRFREPTLRNRRLVLVCDVSGSMEPYTRMLLQYLQAVVATNRPAEAFVFGTRLTRVTHELSGRDPDLALERAGGAVFDWSSGTRIGDCISELNRVYSSKLGRGSVVVILSDGWDRGDPELLSNEIQRLKRCSYRLVWLNPLKAHPDYEPLTRGMRAAIPHIDHFLAGNSLASLQQLADVLEEDVG